MSDRAAGVSRRAFLRTGGTAAALGTLSLAGCDALSTNPSGSSDGGGGGDKSGKKGGGTRPKESPMLAKQVKQGKLPALEKRLPKNPKVDEPVEQPGDYGGKWRDVLFGSSEGSWLGRTMGYEHLARWWSDPPASIPKAIPNVAEKIEVNADGTKVTIHLRAGMKWSDGHPFTADDVVFAQNDINNNTDLRPVPPWKATAKKLDDQTVQLDFDDPEGLFISKQAGPFSNGLADHPKHHLTKFHKKYNPDVKELAKKEKFDSWIDLFASKENWLENIDLPTLRPWNPTNSYTGGTHLNFERNPYYWKTDPDGRQLPYIDRVRFQILNSVEPAVLKVSDGEVDYIDRTVNTIPNKPVFARNRKKGKFRFFDRRAGKTGFTVIYLNLTHKDKVKREIFQNKDFRIGLSYAINRPEIIKTVFLNQGQPRQPSPLPASPYYDKEMEQQYTQYSVSKANAHLDKAFPDKDGSGHRLGPDGKPISFSIEFATAFYPEWPDALELVKKYWKAVGVSINIRSIDRSLLYERKDANTQDANVWEAPGAWRDDVLLDPRCYFPFSSESNYATPWAQWFNTEGKEGQEPPAATKHQMGLYRKILHTTDHAEQDRLMKKILAIAKDEFYEIGVNGYPPSYGIATNRFRNVPEEMVGSWVYQWPGKNNPEQFYIKSDLQ